ncbi:MAG: HAD-IIB family hydrolase [Oscillospiraceae bacterium]|nr:HAD-IIB family hydrolase [Oscillospiraceae bacterium]
MGKFTGVLLASDFDDTFVGRRTESVSPENLKALEYFKSQGGTFTIATGRSYTTFLPQLYRCPVNAPVVLSNGAMGYDFAEEREIYRTELPLRCVEDIRTLMAALPNVAFEACHGEDIYVHNPNRVTELHLKKVGVPYTLSAIEDIPLPWIKVLFEESHEGLEKVQRFMLENFGDVYELVFSNKVLLEMTAKNCHKGSGVLQVAALKGIVSENIFTVGDNCNDISMFNIARMGFAPADCAAEVKDSGATLVSSSDEHAIADVIEIIDKMY